MKEYITDNNRWLSSANNKPVRADGSVVKEGDEDAIENPNYGVTTEFEYQDAPFVRKWDAFDFKMRFTADERKAIRAAAKVDADVEDFVDMLDTAAATQTLIHADNQLVISALNAMEGTIIANGRKAEILGE